MHCVESCWVHPSRSIAVFGPISKVADKDLITPAQLADACTKLGSIMALIDPKDKARRAYEQAHEVAEGLVASHPNDPFARTACRVPATGSATC